VKVAQEPRKPLNPHIALSVAAALAHRQLSPERRAFYDVEHYSAVLNRVAQALIRVAQIHVGDGEGSARRALSEPELDGAIVRRGATVLALADGRSLRHLSVLREDLRSAITILRRAGVRAFDEQPKPKDGG
jgi:hypothetical protein